MNTEIAISVLFDMLSDVENVIKGGKNLNNFHKNLESLTIGIECWNDFENDFNSSKDDDFPLLFDYLLNPRSINFKVGIKVKNLISTLEESSFKIFGNNIISYDLFVKKLCRTLLSVLFIKNELKESNILLFNKIDLNNIIQCMIENIPLFEDMFSIILEKKNAGSFAIDEEDDLEEDDIYASKTDFAVSEGSHSIGGSESVKFPKSKADKVKSNADYQLHIKKLQQDPSIKALFLSKNKIKRKKDSKERITYVAKKNSMYDCIDSNIRDLLAHKNESLLKSLEEVMRNNTINIVNNININSNVIIDGVNLTSLSSIEDLQNFFQEEHTTIVVDDKKIIIPNFSKFKTLYGYVLSAIKTRYYIFLLNKMNVNQKHINVLEDDVESALICIESEIKTIRFNVDRIKSALTTFEVNKNIIDKANQYISEYEIIIKIKDIKDYFYNLDKNIKMNIFNSKFDEKCPNEYLHFLPDVINACQLIVNSINSIQSLDVYNKFASKFEFTEIACETNDNLPLMVPLDPKKYNLNFNVPIMVKPTKIGNFIFELKRAKYSSMSRAMSPYYFDKLNFVKNEFEYKLSSMKEEHNNYYPELQIKETNAILNSKRDQDFYDIYKNQLNNNCFYHSHLSIGYILNRYKSNKRNSAPILNQEKNRIINKDVLFALQNNFNVFDDFLTNTKKQINTISNKSIISVINSDIKCLERIISIYKGMSNE